jgi:hypothetical protein
MIDRDNCHMAATLLHAGNNLIAGVRCGREEL